MMTNRQLFLNYLASTSGSPLMLEIGSAKGVYLYSPGRKKFLDIISGVSVSYLGHNHPEINQAIKDQVNKHLHVMVYGEFIQSSQVEFAELLCRNLPGKLQNVYFVNSGTEAIEGAMKLSKRYTGRSEIIAFENAYHGSTQGAMSLMGKECFKTRYRPLLPDIRFLRFNQRADLNQITEKTACVFAEPVQAEAGVILPKDSFLPELKQKCHQTGTLLVFDEVQTGFGRLGELFACQHYNVTPDILVLAKSLGGGMPLGAFISSREIMSVLARDPELGHITTFGGHPVSCAAGLAAFKILLRENLHKKVKEKELLFREYLRHPEIKEIRGEGLLLAVELGDPQKMHKVIEKAKEYGIITDWFLFCETAIRISPALNITAEEIMKACKLFIKSVEKAVC